MPGPDYHAWTHRPEEFGGTDPLQEFGTGIYAIEVFEVDIPVSTGDNKFNWEIPEDLDEAVLLKVEGYVNEVGAGVTQVQIAKEPEGGGSNDMLVNKITIEAGDLNSKDSPTQPTVNASHEQVFWGDHLRVDVDAAGGVTGLGVILYFVPLRTKRVAVEGAQGEPGGGATEFTGGWQTATGYTIGQSVSNGGSSYVAITNHTSGATTEPGVGVDWEDAWQLLSEKQSSSGLAVTITGNYPLDAGVKAYLYVPFSCTIIAATLLAHTVGNCVVDIWKDTYGNHPPVDADSITGASPLALTASNKTLDTTLSGWTTSLTQGDVLAFNIDSITGIQILTIGLNVERT